MAVVKMMSDVAFLNQVEELQAAVRVFLRDRDDEPEVRFNQLLFRLLRFGFAPKNHLERALQFRRAHLAGDFDFAQLLPAPPQVLARLGLHVGFRRVHAALELHNFALEEMHALHGLSKNYKRRNSMADKETGWPFFATSCRPGSRRTPPAITGASLGSEGAVARRRTALTRATSSRGLKGLGT